MTRRIEVATLVVKVASRCNMDCSYCYIYHGQDTSWKSMPRTMRPAVFEALVDEVAGLHQTQQTKPNVLFHGGEPLLLGISRLRDVVAALVHRVPDISMSIQTNGTIYNSSLERLLLDNRANLTFSVSVDGFAPENDRHRIGLRDSSVYHRIDATLKRSSHAGVLDNILMVVDIRNDPVRIHQFMIASGARHYNILLQDGDHDHLPSGKSDRGAMDVGHWLWKLFRIYAAGPQEFRIKFFDDISLSLLKRARGIQTPTSTYSLCTMTVDTDGEVKQADTFRVNRDGADRLAGENIVESKLHDLANSPANQASLKSTEELSPECIACRYLDACGGGFPSHRSKGGSFRHPSIYCADYLYLFEHMERALCH